MSLSALYNNDHATKAAIIAQATKLMRDHGRMAAAQYIARTVFAGKVDKGGHPYYGHLHRVAMGIADPDLAPLGYLHDLFEDFPDWTGDDLLAVGFSAADARTLYAVTRNAGELYFESMVRCGLDPRGPVLKQSDLTDNSNFLRLPRHLQHDPDMLEKKHVYFLSYYYLADIRSGVIPTGHDFAAWLRTQPDYENNSPLLLKHYRSRPFSMPTPAPVAA